MRMGDLKKIICVGCSLLCDDIMIELKDKELEHVYHACSKGYYYLKSLNDSKRHLKSQLKDGNEYKDLEIQDAISKAAEMIKSSKHVLIYGLNNSSNEAIGTAIVLADKIGGSIDSSATYYKGMAIQQILSKKLPVANFKDIMDKGDTILFWGTNPSSSHLRLLSKYVVLTRGELTQKGKEDRNVALIDIFKTQMRRLSDIFLRVNPGEDDQLLQALIDLIDGKPLQAEKIAGIPKSEVEDLTSTLKRIDFGAIFFGSGLFNSNPQNISSLITLVNKLNSDTTKISMIPTAVLTNTVGFCKIMLDKTGSVNYDFDTKSPKSLIEEVGNGNVDLLILVNSDPFEHLPASITEKLKEIPIISLTTHPDLSTKHAELIIPISLFGLEHGGTLNRMDFTEINVQGCLEPPEKVWSEEKILKEIMNKL